MACLFTYLLAHQTFKLGRWPSLLAGLVYSLSGFFVVHIQQTNILLVITYLPLNWWLVEKIYQNKKLKWALMLSFVFALQILAGHIEFFYYCLLLSGLFWLSLVLTGQKPKVSKSLILLFLAGILAAGLAAVQIALTGEMIMFSNRAEGVGYEISASSAWPLKSLEIFINPKKYDIYQPDLPTEPGKPPLVNIFNVYGYIGLLPLILGLFAITKFKKNRFILILTVMLILSYLWGVGKATQLFAILWQAIPGMQFFRYPVKILFFVEFILALLAGFGLKHLLDSLKNKWSVKKSLVNVLGIIVVLIVFMDLYINNCQQMTIVKAKDWFTTPYFAQFIKNQDNEQISRFYTFANLDYKTIRDYELQKSYRNFLFPNFNLIYETPSSQWLSAFGLDSHLKLQFISRVGIKDNKLILSDSLKKALMLQSVKYFISGLPVEDQDFTLVKSLDLPKDTKHYAFKTTADGSMQAVLTPMKEIYLYEYNKDLWHINLVNKYKVLSNEQALEEIVKQEFDPSSEVILNEEPTDISLENNLGVKEVKLTDYQNHKVKILTHTDQPALLVLADTYYPGWQAYVDNKPSKIYQANYAFRAVAVPAGEHQVEFIFKPSYFKIGMIISLISLFLLIVGFAISLKQK
jgi:hypothetical protein